jgi:hypothetical protein
MVPPNFVPIPDKVIDDEEAETIDESRVEGNVVLARRRGEYCVCLWFQKLTRLSNLRTFVPSISGCPRGVH